MDGMAAANGTPSNCHRGRDAWMREDGAAIPKPSRWAEYVEVGEQAE
jgi:hypothetical protein